jgi:GNAT superfamily N-acetyltransferase
MLKIRPTRAEEAASLSALALRSKAYWGYDEAFLTRCRAELTVPVALAGSDRCFALEDAHLLGFYALGPRDGDHMSLEFLFLEPSAIARGHGRALIAHARGTARAHAAAWLEIEGDPHAEAFYLAVGARRIGERASASIPGRVLPLFALTVGATGCAGANETMGP